MISQSSQDNGAFQIIVQSANDKYYGVGDEQIGGFCDYICAVLFFSNVIIYLV